MRNATTSAFQSGPTTRLIRKPPKPRQSQSPALKARKNEVQPELPEKEGSSLPKQRSCAKIQEDMDSVISLLADAENRDLYSRVEQLRSCLARDNMLESNPWSKETSATGESNPNHFMTPVLTEKNAEVNLLNTAVELRKPARELDPSTDILAQWRLRRRMETAQQTVNPNFPCDGLSSHMRPVVHQTTPIPLNTVVNPYSTRTFNTVFHPAFQQPIYTSYPAPLVRSNVGTQTDHKLDHVHSSTQTDDNPKSYRDMSTITSEFPKTTTDSGTSPCIPDQRSVRIMAFPCRRDVFTQTFCDTVSFQTQQHIDCDIQKASKNFNYVCKADKSEQHSTPVPPSNYRRSEFHNMTLVDTTLGDGDSESVQHTETGSGWQLSSLSSTPSPLPHVEPAHFGSRARAATIECFLFTDNSTRMGRPTTDRVSQAERDNRNRRIPLIEAQCVASKIPVSKSISNYLQQAADNGPMFSKFPDDELLQALIQCRVDCLEQMRAVIQEIHTRELELLEKAKCE